jgi:hypothetical protein
MVVGVKIFANDGRVQINATGGETSLAFDFAIYDEDHIKIVRTRAGLDTTLVITTDYTVPLASINDEDGGTVTLVSPALNGDRYTLLLNVPYERITDFSQAGDFLADSLNLQLDLMTQQNQQIVRDAKRSPKFPESAVIGEIPLPVPSANASLVFNSDATAIINGPELSELTSAAATASAAAATATAAASSASSSETSAEASALAAAASAAQAGSSVNVLTTIRNNKMVPWGPSTVAATNSAFEQLCSKYPQIQRGKNGGRNGQNSMSQMDNIYTAVIAQKPAWVLMHGSFGNDMGGGSMADAPSNALASAGSISNAKYNLTAALDLFRSFDIKVIVCPEMVEQEPGTRRTNILAWNAALPSTIAARNDSGILYVDTASLITDASGNPLIPHISTTATGTSGSPDIMVASATGIVRGMHPDDVTDLITSATGKPRIKNISGTTITLSGNLAGAMSATPVVFMTDYEDFTHYSTVGHEKCAVAIYNAMNAAGWLTGYESYLPMTSSNDGSNVENLAGNGLLLGTVTSNVGEDWFSTFATESVTTNANFRGNVQRVVVAAGEALGSAVGHNAVDVTSKQGRKIGVHFGTEASNFIVNGAVYSVVLSFDSAPPSLPAGAFPDETSQPIVFYDIDLEGKRSWYAECYVPTAATTLSAFVQLANEDFPSTAASSGQIDVGDLLVVDIDDPIRNASSGGSSQWTTTGSDIYYGTGGVKVGAASAPHVRAALEVDSTTKGFLLPRMTAAQMATLGTLSPPDGLMLYTSDLSNPYIYSAFSFKAVCIDFVKAAFFQAAELGFGEQGTNGASKTTLKAQDSLAADNIVTLPATAGTLGLETAIGTVQATTSGVSKTFTGITAATKRITLLLNNVSTNGTSNLLIQLGDSGGLETTSYSGIGMRIPSAAANAGAANTSGFLINSALAAATLCGSVVIELVDPSTNTWVCSGIVTDTTNTITIVTNGVKSLSATLDRIAILTANGTDAFDAGSINILTE